MICLVRLVQGSGVAYIQQARFLDLLFAVGQATTCIGDHVHGCIVFASSGLVLEFISKLMADFPNRLVS